jgi:hypothetical protein
MLIQRQIQPQIEAALFKGKNPWFWRTYDQKELDFVEESGGEYAGFEFKWGGGSSRGAKAFQAVYPGSTVEVVEPGNIWDFGGGETWRHLNRNHAHVASWRRLGPKALRKVDQEFRNLGILRFMENG